MSSVSQLQQVLSGLDEWLVITGAGISAQSGIPTYRDAEGNWMRSDPITHQEFIGSEEKRKRYWARSAVGWPSIANAQPNDVHRALASMEQKGLLVGLITQNVDRLHQKAGHQNVIDLHGRLDRVRCLQCNNYELREELQARLLVRNPFLTDVAGEIAPDGDANIEDAITQRIQPESCLHCNGILMPDVVFYGGTVPKETHQATANLYQKCKGILVLGSSLMVYSSFRFCKQAHQDGKQIIVINKGKTRADEICLHKFDMDCSLISQFSGKLM